MGLIETLSNQRLSGLATSLYCDPSGSCLERTPVFPVFQTMTTLQHNSLTQQLQIGAVSYLNSRPLIEGLDELLPSANLVLDYPSRLADSLADGSLDVALIPSVEYFRRPGYEVVSDACVAARGEVLSVKLYCRVHPGSIRRLALDEGSRTSAALTKVILADRYGVIPKTEPLKMESTTRDSTADAVLLIAERPVRRTILVHCVRRTSCDSAGFS